jgi:hypothetical protein
MPELTGGMNLERKENEVRAPESASRAASLRLDSWLQWKQSEDSFEGEQEHALDNLCDSARTVAIRAGHLVYVGWVYSHLLVVAVVVLVIRLLQGRRVV